MKRTPTIRKVAARVLGIPFAGLLMLALAAGLLAAFFIPVTVH
jgi:hypothetical protein